MVMEPAARGPEPLRILYVCRLGLNRSVVLAAYTNNLAGERGVPVTAASAGSYPEAMECSRRRLEYVADFLKRAHRGRHHRYVTAALRETDVHPFASALLLEEGVPEILEIRQQAATPALLQRADLVLAVDGN